MYNCFKKWNTVLVFLFTVALSSMFASQASAQLWFGGGLIYGGGIEKLGVQANTHFVISEENKLRLGLDLSYFLIEKAKVAENTIKNRLFAINVNGQYMLISSDEVVIYGIGGLNLSFVNTNVTGPQSQFIDFVDTSSTELGLNVGGGVDYIVPFGQVYVELKYILGGYDQMVLAAGVRVPIGGG